MWSVDPPDDDVPPSGWMPLPIEPPAAPTTLDALAVMRLLGLDEPGVNDELERMPDEPAPELDEPFGAE
jgi:hypothetical protein